MKVSQIPIIFAILVPAIAALPEGEKSDVAANAKVDAGTLSCGAEGSCVGVGGGDLCNDRCKQCEGPSGKYTKGECGGFGWQTCQCFYG